MARLSSTKSTHLVKQIYHFEGSSTSRVPFSSKEYSAPDRVRLELTSYTVQNPVTATLSKIIEHKVWLTKIVNTKISYYIIIAYMYMYVVDKISVVNV